MTTEDTTPVAEAVEAALNPETFDFLDYLDEQPVAEDSFDIYMHLPSARRLDELMTSRAELLFARREAEKRGEATSLSISDDDEDTEYDDEINELVQKLESTKATFRVQSVAPSLRKAIEKKYQATEDKTWTDEEKAKHSNKRVADILSRAITSVTRGDNAVDSVAWDADRLLKAEDKLYEKQAERLIQNLWNMVYVGDVFDKALTADFS